METHLFVYRRIIMKFKIYGYNEKPDHRLHVFTNDSDEPLWLDTKIYDFRYSALLSFDRDGRVYEGGGDLVDPGNRIYGSPQLGVTVPPRGFLACFGRADDPELAALLDRAMEGAMLYNATMSLIYPMRASLDRENDELTVEYDEEIKENIRKKILFVGNSSTYFNGTPIKLKGICRAENIAIDVVYCTFGSAYLHEFADESHERGITMRKKLKSEKYDLVFLQDAGGAEYEDSLKSLKTIMPYIKENGAEAVMYMRYAGCRGDDERDATEKRHEETYSRLGKDFDCAVSPVAKAFGVCRHKYPEINLYADDAAHHSREGSYLIAAQWFKTLFGRTPNGEYLAGIDRSVVEKLLDCVI